MQPIPMCLDDANFDRESEEWKTKSPFLFVLRAYGIALLKGCYYVNELVKDELYYEVRCFRTAAIRKPWLRLNLGGGLCDKHV